MLLPDDLALQIRSELAVVELTIVSTCDLCLALGEPASATAMAEWLGRVAPKGTIVEHDVPGQQFVLRRNGRLKAR